MITTVSDAEIFLDYSKRRAQNQIIFRQSLLSKACRSSAKSGSSDRNEDYHGEGLFGHVYFSYVCQKTAITITKIIQSRQKDLNNDAKIAGFLRLENF